MKFKYLAIYILLFLQWLLPPEKLFAQVQKLNVGDEFFLERLLEQVSEAKYDTTKLRLYSEVYRHHYNYDTIIKYAALAVELSEKLEDRRAWSEANMFIGAIYNSQSKNDSAEICFRKALPYWEEIKDTTKLAVSYNCLAVLDENRNIYESALENYNRALTLFLENGDTARAARIYRGIANTYTGFNVQFSAREYAEKALEIDTRYQDTMSVAFDLVYLGNIWISEYYNTGEVALIDSAKKYYARGLAEAEKSNFLDVVGEAALELQKLCLEIANVSSGEKLSAAIDSSLVYKALSKNCIAKMSNKVKEYVYDINEGKEFVLTGRYKEAKKIIDKYSALFLSNLSEYENLYYEALGSVIKLYYLKLADYKALYDWNEKYLRYRRLRFNIIFATGGEFNKRKAEYVKRDKKINDETAKRKKEFSIQRSQWRMTVCFLAIILTIILLIMLILRKNYRMKQRVEKFLRKQNDDIMKVNAELMKIQETAMLQTAEIQTQSQKIKEQNEEISATNLAVIHSIEYAGQIQIASMPQQSDIDKIFKDNFLIYNPLEIVSGDFYWIGETKKFRLIGVFDCTGHGIPGGLLSMLGISTLNDTQQSLTGENIAAAVLNSLRKKILSATSEDIYDGTDGAVVAVSKEGNTLHIAGAMRPVWIMRDGKFLEFFPDRMSIGRDKRQNEDFTGYDFKYQNGDKVYMFTDGVTDVFGYADDGKGGEKLLKFSQKRLKALICQISDLSFAEQKSIIVKTLEDWQKGLKQDTRVDDQLMIGFAL